MGEAGAGLLVADERVVGELASGKGLGWCRVETMIGEIPAQAGEVANGASSESIDNVAVEARVLVAARCESAGCLNRRIADAHTRN